MDTGAVFGRSVGFPPRIGADGRVCWSEGEDNIRESINIILMTDRNERIQTPDFGAHLTEFLFEPNTTSTRHAIGLRIESALKQWEPRIKVDAVTVEADPADARAAIATIGYRLIATQERRSAAVTVQTGGAG